MSIPTGDGIASYLRDSIVTGRLAAGAKLPSERSLSEDFGVSRPVVREVLRGLSEQGLVEIQPARGTFVKAPEAVDGARSLDVLYRRKDATVRELMEVRLMLETQSARLAALHATSSEVRAMRWCLDEFAKAGHVLEEAQLDLAFHALVIKASHNTVFDIIYGSISPLVFELMLRSLSDHHVKSAGAPLHEQLWTAIRDHDPDAAAAIMADHLTMAEFLYGSDYDRSIDALASRELEKYLGPATTIDSILAEVGRRHTEFMRFQIRRVEQTADASAEPVVPPST